MGLDIYFGTVCKPIEKQEPFNTLEYPQLDIFAPLGVKVTKQMTNLKAIAEKLNYELPFRNWCYSDELQMNKKGLYFHYGLQSKGVKFEDLMESEETFYEFSLQESHGESHWIAAAHLKPSFYFPFIFEREKALALIPSLKTDYEYLLPFLENFETGKHFIYLGY